MSDYGTRLIQLCEKLTWTSLGLTPKIRLVETRAVLDSLGAMAASSLLAENRPLRDIPYTGRFSLGHNRYLFGKSKRPICHWHR